VSGQFPDSLSLDLYYGLKNRRPSSTILQKQAKFDKLLEVQTSVQVRMSKTYSLLPIIQPKLKSKIEIHRFLEISKHSVQHFFISFESLCENL